MIDPLLELQEMAEPLLRKHPEAVTVRDVMELQRLARYALTWSVGLMRTNELAIETFDEVNERFDRILSHG